MTTQELFARAAELLQTHGWIQGIMGSPTRGFCVIGAIDFAAWERWPALPVSDDTYRQCTQLLRNEISVDPNFDGTTIGWNDAPGRTREEVVALLTRLAGRTAAEPAAPEAKAD